jgi:hypothetical protein
VIDVVQPMTRACVVAAMCSVAFGVLTVPSLSVGAVPAASSVAAGAGVGDWAGQRVIASGLVGLVGLGVDEKGETFFLDRRSGGAYRVADLRAGSVSAASIVPSGLMGPSSVATDGAGDVVVADAAGDNVMGGFFVGAGNNRVQHSFGFTGLDQPGGVAVYQQPGGPAYGLGDADVFVADTNNNRVLELAHGSSVQRVLPFSGLKGPTGLAVDAAGDVFVCDTGNHRVLELVHGSSRQRVLKFRALKSPVAVAVDAAGDVFVADRSANRVLELVGRAGTQRVVPFTGLSQPSGVAVDIDGDVMVSDSGKDRVLELPADSVDIRKYPLPVTSWTGYTQLAPPSTPGFTGVRATFDVPTLDSSDLQCPASIGTSPCFKLSDWVGIGGIAENGNLIQAGIELDVKASGVIDQLYAWTEALPGSEVPLPTVPINMGDEVSVTISQVSAGHWTITVADLTTRQSASRSVAYDSDHSSVEAISERVNGGDDNAGPALTPTNTTVFQPVQYLTPGATSWHPLFDASHGSTLYSLAMRTDTLSDYGTATPSAPNANGDGFSIAGGTVAPLASGGWPLPGDHPATGGLTPTGTGVGVLSCPAAGSCRGAAQYTVGKNTQLGVLESQHDGTWRDVRAPLPANAVTKNALVWFRAISCATPSVCVAVGTYYAKAGGGVFGAPLIETLSHGRWRATEPKLPKGASKAYQGTVALTSVSCVTKAHCVAVGQYVAAPTAHTINHVAGVIDVLAHGKWTARQAVLPNHGKAKVEQVELNGVACTTPTFCVAVGDYSLVSGMNGGPVKEGPLVETLDRGRWSARQPPVQHTVPSDTTVSLTGVACGATGTCDAIALVGSNHGSTISAGIDLLRDRSWHARIAPVPSDAYQGGSPELNGISCANAKSCVAVGDYENVEDNHGDEGENGLIEHISRSAVTDDIARVPPSTSTPGLDYTFLYDVACGSRGPCDAVGSYADTTGASHPLIDTVSGGDVTDAVPLPPDASPDYGGWGQNAMMESVACASSGSCESLGVYEDTNDVLRTLLTQD